MINYPAYFIFRTFDPLMTSMKKLFLTLITSVAFSANLAIASTPTAPTAPFISPTPPSIAGSANYMIDFNSGKVLSEKNAELKIEPASLTKIMTGYVVFNELKLGRIQLDDMVDISAKAWKMPGSRMFIEVGKKVSVEDLIKGMIIQSGNDASVALAEYIARSEDNFAQLMNQYAAQLGMENTNFENATGLPGPNHLTTAKDLAILSKALIQDFPEYYSWYSEKSFTFNGITQYNRNRLLWQDETVDGLKTGHTNSAGYCLVSSAKKENMRIISVVVGADNATQRISESQKLINYAFRFFETHKLFDQDQRLDETKVWGGNLDQIGVGLEEDLYVTVPRSQFENIKIEKNLPTDLNAPIAKGDKIGEIVISLHDEVLSTKPLVALADVEEGSFFKRLFDQIKLFFYGLFN